MEQKQLLDSIVSSLDQAANFGVLFAVTAIVSIATAISKSDTLSIGPLTIPRRQASLALRVFYVFVQLVFLLLLARIASLAGSIDENNLAKAITRILTHESLLHPFAYFGGDGIGQIVSGTPLVLFVHVWWLGSVSLALSISKKKLYDLVYMVGFMALGIFLFIGQYFFFEFLLESAKGLKPVAIDLRSWRVVRCWIVILSSLTGFFIAIAILVRIDKHEKEAAKRKWPL